MTTIDWALYTEQATGKGAPMLADVINRPLRQVLTISGADPDTAFAGFFAQGATTVMVPGQTQLSIRNHANTVDNFTFADDGTFVSHNDIQANGGVRAVSTDGLSNAELISIVGPYPSIDASTVGTRIFSQVGVGPTPGFGVVGTISHHDLLIVVGIGVDVGSLTAIACRTTQSVLIGKASLATTATIGFPYIPTCAGAPTGVPTAETGFAPVVVDATENRLYVYVSGVWKFANLS